MDDALPLPTSVQKLSHIRCHLALVMSFGVCIVRTGKQRWGIEFPPNHKHSSAVTHDISPLSPNWCEKHGGDKNWQLFIINLWRTTLSFQFDPSATWKNGGGGVYYVYYSQPPGGELFGLHLIYSLWLRRDGRRPDKSDVNESPVNIRISQWFDLQHGVNWKREETGSARQQRLTITTSPTWSCLCVQIEVILLVIFPALLHRYWQST